jgi:hypothetical protein
MRPNLLFSPLKTTRENANCHLSFDGTVISDVSCVINLGGFFFFEKKKPTYYGEASKYHCEIVLLPHSKYWTDAYAHT